MQHYGQNKEDLVIAEYFQRRQLMKGNLLDIGAADGLTFSNSRLLIEQGWTATLVEPDPRQVSSLVRLYGGNPNVIIDPSAVVATEDVDFVTFSMCSDPFLSSMATGSEYTNHVHKWSSLASFNTTVQVPAAPVSKYDLEQFDFINLDVESHNLSIFAVIVSRLTPESRVSCICVEHDSNIDVMVQALAGLGFTRHCINGENIISQK
jgi:FkbM family methyltransferase